MRSNKAPAGTRVFLLIRLQLLAVTLEVHKSAVHLMHWGDVLANVQTAHWLERAQRVADPGAGGT